MRIPHIGETCQYFLDATSEPVAAIVTGSSLGNKLCLALLYPNVHNMDLADGVPHLSEAEGWDREAIGFWDYIPTTTRKQDDTRKKASAEV